MSTYNKSNYALNRNKKAIVYQNADGSFLEITFEKIAEGDPSFTERDFEKLKAFSDQLYLDEQRGDTVYHKHVKGTYDEVEDSKWLASESFENDLLDKLEKISKRPEMMAYINQSLTPVQRRRFLMYIEGITTRKIAEIEGTNQNAVWKSIEQSKRKLKKFLNKF